MIDILRRLRVVAALPLRALLPVGGSPRQRCKTVRCIRAIVRTAGARFPGAAPALVGETRDPPEVAPIRAGGIAAETTRQFLSRLSTYEMIGDDSTVVEPRLEILG